MGYTLSNIFNLTLGILKYKQILNQNYLIINVIFIYSVWVKIFTFIMFKHV